MRLTFRRRLLLTLLVIGAVPLAGALLVVSLQVRSAASPSGPRAALDEIAASGGRLEGAVDTVALDSIGRGALRDHLEIIADRTRIARRAERLSRYAAVGLGVVVAAATVVVVLLSLMVARRWASGLSAPIETLVDWTRRIERREPIPSSDVDRGIPEFAVLASALRQLGDAIDTVRQRELEQERFRAYRETARRVAHEIRGPVTALRLAVRQIEVNPEAARMVLDEESARLDAMAREFSEFGRLPEGPVTRVDLSELVGAVIAATIPEGLPVATKMASDLGVRGHYEPLRRAVQNLMQNAVEADATGPIEVTGTRTSTGIEVVVRDRGPGIAEDVLGSVFEPYVTAKRGGTGLGLAMVRQTIESHGGSVHARNHAEGGAEFTVILPEGT